MAGSIAGQVINQRDGQPIEGAALELRPRGGETTSGRDGSYQYTGLAAGNDYELTIRKTGFEAGIYGPLVVIDGGTTKLIVALQPKNI